MLLFRSFPMITAGLCKKIITKCSHKTPLVLSRKDNRGPAINISSYGRVGFTKGLK